MHAIYYMFYWSSLQVCLMCFVCPCAGMPMTLRETLCFPGMKDVGQVT